jgi:RNA polymerase sigma factor (sigma-70 family)
VSPGSPQRVGVRAALSRTALRLQSDRRLVALTRAGSGVAFSVIVERYRAPLLSYCRRLLGPEDAEDVIQQTFANALRALRVHDRNVELKPWLYRIAHNNAINAVSRSGRDHEQLDEQYDGVPQPPALLEQKQRLQSMVDEIGRLPARQRTAIVAHELDGRSYEEIARDMDASTPVVRQLIYRARTRLRDTCGVFLPVWALRWLVFADLRAPGGGERVGEAVAGGSAGAGLLKAGTVLVASGAIATGAGGIIVKDIPSPHKRGARSGAIASFDDLAAPGPAPRSVQAHSNREPSGLGSSASDGDSPNRGPATSPDSGGRHRSHPRQGDGQHGDRGGSDGQQGDDEPDAGKSHESSYDGRGGDDEESSGSEGDSHGDSGGGEGGDSSGSSDGSDSPDGSGGPDPAPEAPPEPKVAE